MSLKKITKPVLFQGNTKSRSYFEGWYYKQVSKDSRKAISFIPGISLSGDDAHSFILYIYVNKADNNKKIIKTGFIRYPLEDFEYDNDNFYISIKDNCFSESGLSVNLSDDDMTIEGNLEFGPLTPIKRSIMAPNIMGIFAYIPKMECYHGIVSMNHKVFGNLNINGEKLELDGGSGYIEKDWGKSFPRKYVWIQCNNFSDENTAITCSAADIPFLGTYFPGFFANLMIDSMEYRFATYNKSKFKVLRMTDKDVTLLFENRKATMLVEAKFDEAGELAAPKQGGMKNIIKEGLSGNVQFRLFDKRSGKAYEDYGQMAGIEITE
ncbi:MAG: tocopherol cyclase family protein [Clostridiaceae bacterium]